MLRVGSFMEHLDMGDVDRFVCLCFSRFILYPDGRLIGPNGFTFVCSRIYAFKSVVTSKSRFKDSGLNKSKQNKIDLNRVCILYYCNSSCLSERIPSFEFTTDVILQPWRLLYCVQRRLDSPTWWFS